jgi:hypothetical protein
MQSVTGSHARPGGGFCALLIKVKAARRRWASAYALQHFSRSIPMMDVVMLAIGFVFFALSIAYVYACDRL